MKLRLFAVALTLSLQPLLWAQNNSCSTQVQQLLRNNDIDGLRQTLNNDPRIRNINTLLRHPQARQLIDEESLLRLIADEENLYFHPRLENLLDSISQHASNPQNLRRSLEEQLELAVPADSIAARIDNYLAQPNLQNLRRILGEMEIEEQQRLVFGNNPLDPSPESLLGRFISESQTQSVVRAFKQQPNSDQLGPERLVVSLSRDNFELFQKYFATRMDLLMHNHTPRQGTLQVLHQNHIHHWTKMGYASGSEFRLPSEGTIIPTILLNTREAQRTRQFFMLGQHDYSLARNPWNLDGYCATGGYSSCTHWFGNIPIGDRMVREYKFPGFVDQYAANHLKLANGSIDTANDALPRIQRLAEYPNLSGKDNALIRRVWKAPEGNEQLSSVLGLLENNVRGEFASPGFVGMSLSGSAPVERVPIVFVVVPDHRIALRADFDPQLNAY